jgi:hypothetical protein
VSGRDSQARSSVALWCQGIKCPYACGGRCAREGFSSEAEPAREGREPSSDAEPARGGRESPSEAEPARGAREPSSEAEPAQGGAPCWAAMVGRRGHHSVGRALCACLDKRCVLFLFFAGFKQGSPRFFRGPPGLSPTGAPPRAVAGSFSAPTKLPNRA